MTAHVHLEHDYEASPERVWALATDFAALEKVCAGTVTFDGLPEGRCRTGQSIDVSVRLFGRLPPQPYHMDVLECDDATMTLRSAEKGAGVRTWRHTLTVRPQGSGARLTDDIEIDAGWLTPAFSAWARYLYRSRHKPRLHLLQTREF